MSSFKLVLGFLTSIPIRLSEPPEQGDLGRAAAWFPLVGLGLGVVLALTHGVIGKALPVLLTGALVTSLWAALTGGLHLDGLADCFDGLTVSASTARRLEIMKDPRLGAFGAVGLILFLILKVSAVASLPDGSGLILAPIMGRWMVLLAAVLPQARPGGMGDEFHGTLNRRGLTVAALLTAGVAGLFGWRGLLAFGLAHAAGFALLWLARKRLGGGTGDVLGAACEFAELAVLIAFILEVQV